MFIPHDTAACLPMGYSHTIHTRLAVYEAYRIREGYCNLDCCHPALWVPCFDLDIYAPRHG
jgi:hypothetical protein